MITKLIDAQIELAEKLNTPIDYIVMSIDHAAKLTDSILKAAGMGEGEVEFDALKSYRGVKIRIHSAPALKVVYTL